MKQKEAKRQLSKHPMVLCLVFLFLTILQSCISDDEIKFPEEKGIDGYASSVAIISTLRAIENEKMTDNDDCFAFTYPLNLQYNNDIQIAVTELSGLKEIAENAVESQHINAIAFPFEVSKAGISKDITSESAFIDLLDDCGIPTLRDEFDPFYTQCFDFVYPIEMWDLDSNVVTINSKEAYFEFEFVQGFEQQPAFIYPLVVYDYASENEIAVDSPFELFEIFDSCKKCPELFFEIDSLAYNRFKFIADFPELDRVTTYGWYIDGVKVEEDGIGVQGDNYLIETFDQGTYEICIKARLPEDDCFSGTEYCTTIVVEDHCPFIFFETIKIDNNNYKFIADFTDQDTIAYNWVIYQNADIIFSEFVDQSGSDTLSYQFATGNYEVCMETELSTCPEPLFYCKEILVE